MTRMTLLLVLLLVTTILPVLGIDVSYYRSSSVFNQRSSFIINHASGGSLIKANINPHDSSLVNYVVNLYMANSNTPIQPSVFLAGRDEYLSAAISTSG